MLPTVPERARPRKAKERALGRREALYLLVLLAFTVLNMLQVSSIRIGTEFRPYPFLVWNLFLAWVPVAFQLLLAQLYTYRKSGIRTLGLLVTGAGWLFFYPNAAYLVTDLLHVFARYPVNPDRYFWHEQAFWTHLFALLLTAMIGLVISSYSLRAVHRLVRERMGAWRGALFAGVVLALSSFGIYLGRFLRLNSWDVLFNPRSLVGELVSVLNPSRYSFLFSFCGGMFLIMLLTYIGFIWMEDRQRESFSEDN
ncbi:DUF1361 domain-containing protein [Gorillibacterium sp. CAU 1737]|uniref:DUF1361 domain-containing protein n=1 Tax=Gorillibacterium sp. CAU 1737 TaxID=3140362 RepID=UPI003260FD50